jgi:hypothetical protein
MNRLITRDTTLSLRSAAIANEKFLLEKEKQDFWYERADVLQRFRPTDEDPIDEVGHTLSARKNLYDPAAHARQQTRNIRAKGANGQPMGDDEFLDAIYLQGMKFDHGEAANKMMDDLKRSINVAVPNADEPHALYSAKYNSASHSNPKH